MDAFEGPKTEMEQIIQKYLEPNPIVEPKPAVLPGDHPLLQPFQQSLKEHLLRIHDKLVNEIAEIDHEIRIKEEEQEDVGAKLYDMQQEILKQNRVMDEYAQQIKEVTEKRIKHEKNVEYQKANYEDLIKEQKESKGYHNERLMELSSLQVLENNIVKWSEEIENEVATAKRIVSKDWQDQQMISEEKKKMDMLLFNIESEVRKREQELNTINEQIKDQTGVLKSLNTSLSDATADLDALQQEHKRLTQSWNEVIIAIQHRDKVLFKVKDELTSEQEQHKIIASSIEAAKKEANKEMRKNEALEAFKSRITADVKNLTAQLEKEITERNKLTAKLAEIECLMKQSEEDYTAAKCEGNALDVQMRKIEAEMDKLVTKKSNMEEKILESAQEQIIMDNASDHRMKLVRETQDQRRKLEIKLSQLENQISNSLLELERWKGIIIRLKEDSEALEKEYMEVNAKSQEKIAELKDAENTININMKLVDQAGKKLDQLVKAKGGTEESPIEREIYALQRQIGVIEREIRDAQKFWLVLQGYVVNLSEKRSIQVNELQIGRKQLTVIEQKSLKVEAEMRKAMVEGKDTTKKIHDMDVKVKLLGNKLFEKKKMQELEEVECQHAHLDIIEKLKDAEMSILKMEQDILDLTQDIEQAKKEVLERHRESLSWESKYRMAEEMNRSRHEEKSHESEIGCMKAEIHRMQIRYNQLKRAQEKLVQDLEHCVMHREQIFVSATTRQKNDANQGRLRSNIQYKLNEVKNKLKQVQNETTMTEINLANKTAQLDQLLTEVNRKQDDIETEKMQENLVQAEIEQSFLLKHQNLENLVRKQHRAKRYRILSSAKTLPKCKSIAAVDAETQKQKEINDNLLDIVQSLLNDFPDKKYQLTKIMQTLRDD